MPHSGSEIVIEPGQIFGELVVRKIKRGAKNIHPLALCDCRCGNSRMARLSDLRRGKTLSCAPCALRAGWRKRPRNSPDERWLLEAEGTYRSNAKRKAVAFNLSREQVRGFLKASCHYCGELRAGGIDRLNGGPYEMGNVVSCCSRCNYAKGEMREDEFIALVAKIHGYRFGP